jgi:phage-related protein
MADKPIYWLGSSKNDIRDFSEEARRKVGFQLRALQKGLKPTDFKPMSIIGDGVEEIRIKTRDAYRVFYVAKFEEAIYVLHAFNKKTQKTSKLDIDLGQKRYQEMQKFRENFNN